MFFHLSSIGTKLLQNNAVVTSVGVRCWAVKTSSSIAATQFSSSTVTNDLHVTLEPLDSPNDGIFMLSLTRTEAKNAIGRQMLSELQEALNMLRTENSTRCVVVRSTAPGVFSAGGDYNERASMSQQDASFFVQNLRAAVSGVAALDMPVVAAIDGFALGSGVELALAADIRVCGRDAQFAFPETRLGIIPCAGGTQRLPRIVGTSRAKELIFSGRSISAGEALRIGLVDHVVADEVSCESAALSLAREIAAAGPIALRMAKSAVRLGVEVDVETGLKIEEGCFAQVLPTKDRMEGLRAFVEKRAPRFTGE